MLRQVLRELRFHPSRFVATVIAIAISVAFMAGSSILVATETNGFQRLQSLPISTADVVVTLGPDADRAAVAKALTGVAGAEASEPSLSMTTTLRNGRATALTELIVLPSEPLRWSRIMEGRWPQAAGELALSRDAAKGLQARIGDRLETGYADTTFTVVGLTDEPKSWRRPPSPRRGTTPIRTPQPGSSRPPPAPIQPRWCRPSAPHSARSPT